MARVAGRRGTLYVGATDSAQASPVTFLRSWSINFTSDRTDVTAMGDTNKTYVAGLPDAAGDYAGFYDDATNQTYTAAVDGLARKFYLYPNNTDTAEYFFGTGFFDFSASSAVDGAVEVSGTWSAASSVSKVAS